MRVAGAWLEGREGLGEAQQGCLVECGKHTEMMDLGRGILPWLGL